jgi:hypothetical protein
MSSASVEFSRRFQLWSYSVSHSELLLRSTKSTGATTRIDVLFKNVGAICLQTIIDNLVVLEVSAGDVSQRWRDISVGERRLFSVSGVGFSGYVVAGSLAWHEDELEYHEPSFFSTRPSR